jgi:hypothetical protein
MLYVHLIPHSHDDLGWLKRVDDYYTGTNNMYSRAKVHLIFSNTVSELLKDSNKRFTFVEMKFFSTWWSV